MTTLQRPQKCAMKSLCSLLLLLIPNTLSIIAQVQQEVVPRTRIAIAHVGVIDTRNGSVELDMTVLIAGNRIAEIDRSSNVKVPTSAQTIDAKSKFLMPGL